MFSRTTGLGLVNPGECVLIVTDVGADPIILQAVKKAYEERGVKVQYITSHELAGVSRKDAMDLYEFTSWAAHNHFGLAGLDRWLGMWDDKRGVQDWLKAQRPDLYKVLNEKLELPPNLARIRQALSRTRESLVKGTVKLSRLQRQWRDGIYL
jgi:hypothetical protein